ncbi:MAG: carboxypeptidase regulatory-like domain-containing protein [Vicinamibacterales bacterium]
MKRVFLTALFVCAGMLSSSLAFAQGGGASSTGTIQGRVTDTSGGVLPGVTVTIASPSLIGGSQVQVTNETGNYRFPAVAPGAYSVTFELPGFDTIKREGIQISLGFTANVNVELGVATLQETVTVSGASPVIDTTATRVQQNFKLDELNSIPNGRDMWSLLAVTPAVSMSRIDVGGNRAGTQTGYTAYGYGGTDQQVRVLVEGINTTEGTGGAGFYFDYGSFEEVFLGTAGNGAEMATPGVQSQLLGKSGGNQFQGAVYQDWYNNALQGSNISDEQIARGIRAGSNEMENYRDFNLNGGGYIKKDTLWWYGSYRNQKNQVNVPYFQFDKTFDTDLWNLSGKGTYLLSQNHKLIGYYQWGQKAQPNRVWSTSYTYSSPDSTRNQDSGSWVYKGEWNGTLSNSLYVEARYGEFGYYFPQIGYSEEPWKHDTALRTVTGGDFRWQQDRQRKQLTGAATYFKDSFLGGSHNVKIGGEYNLESQWNGIEEIRAGNIEHQFTNGVPFQVIIGFPTASGPVGSLSSRDDLLSIAKLDHSNLFISDAFSRGRMTLNLGVRYDHYKSWIPAQQQIASTTAGFSLPAATFPEQTFFTWNSVVPRVGLTYDLRGDGRSVVKANYGFFRHNPGPGAAANGNPNQSSKDATYTWNDLNGDGLFQFGEQGTLVQDRTGARGVQIDPNIKQPYTHEASAFFEQQLTDTLGMRVGYVYKTNDDLTSNYQPFRPISAYTSPFNFTDIGEDGVRGTADDQVLTLYGIPSSELGASTTVFMNTPAIGRYKTIEASVTKRMSNRWSAGAGYNFTWTRENENSYSGNTISSSLSDYPNTPNDAGVSSFTNWGFRAYGAYEGPYGIRISPVFRHQAGQPYGRYITGVRAPAGLFFSGTVLVEPIGTRRMDNINVLDAKIEKAFQLGATARLRGFVDLFNILNANTPETISFATGSAFENPTNIIAPRAMRLGFRFEW